MEAFNRAALAAQDSNADGLIDARDTHFADLRLWVDANGDAVTDAGELHTLAEAGIISLNVAYASSSVVQNGNLLDGIGSFTKADGSAGAMTDVWFQTTEATVQVPVQGQTLSLPQGAAPQGTLNLSDVLAAPAQGVPEFQHQFFAQYPHSAQASAQGLLDQSLLTAQMHGA